MACSVCYAWVWNPSGCTQTWLDLFIHKAGAGDWTQGTWMMPIKRSSYVARPRPQQQRQRSGWRTSCCCCFFFLLVLELNWNKNSRSSYCPMSLFKLRSFIFIKAAKTGGCGIMEKMWLMLEMERPEARAQRPRPSILASTYKKEQAQLSRSRLNAFL